MTEPRNMDEPVTRRELHEALEIWGAILTKNITASVTASINAEMARQIQASDERMRDYMGALLEPHDGVPERVTKLEELEPRVERLEARVFAPKPRRPPARRRARKGRRAAPRTRPRRR